MEPQPTTGTLDVHDFEPDTVQFRREVLEGLKPSQKTLPCKYLYDERGSQIFDEICTVDEYYPTRTETAIMREHGAAMAEAIGERCLILEYGSGSSIKTRILLEHARDPAAYVPLDISREHLAKSAEALAKIFPHLEVMPVCADYTSDFTMPTPEKPVSHIVAYFPGSTIGNFHLDEAEAFLKHVAEVVRTGGGLLIGVDLQKDIATMEAAYNDAGGVTAEFNYNLLDRMNRELGANFQRDGFLFRATWNQEHGRIESHLISRRDQTVTIGEEEIRFVEGETIWTECSYKYTLERFSELAARAGFEIRNVWLDPQKLFSVQYLEVKR